MSFRYARSNVKIIDNGARVSQMISEVFWTSGRSPMIQKAPKVSGTYMEIYWKV
jgi:hypothetical protein